MIYSCGPRTIAFAKELLILPLDASVPESYFDAIDGSDQLWRQCASDCAAARATACEFAEKVAAAELASNINLQGSFWICFGRRAVASRIMIVTDIVSKLLSTTRLLQ